MDLQQDRANGLTSRTPRTFLSMYTLSTFKILSYIMTQQRIRPFLFPLILLILASIPVLSYGLGLYSGRYNYEVTFSDVITTVFTAVLAYFAYLEQKILSKQAQREYEESLPNVYAMQGKVQDNYIMRNTGGSSAWDVTVDMVIEDVDPREEPIKVLYEKELPSRLTQFSNERRFQTPEKWQGIETYSFRVQIRYSTKETKGEEKIWTQVFRWVDANDVLV